MAKAYNSSRSSNCSRRSCVALDSRLSSGTNVALCTRTSSFTLEHGKRNTGKLKDSKISVRTCTKKCIKIINKFTANVQWLYIHSVDYSHIIHVHVHTCMYVHGVHVLCQSPCSFRCCMLVEKYCMGMDQCGIKATYVHRTCIHVQCIYVCKN